MMFWLVLKKLLPCCFLLQARLNEIITSGVKAVHSSSEEKPWMVDGAGLPANASELLPKLVKCC